MEMAVASVIRDRSVGSNFVNVSSPPSSNEIRSRCAASPVTTFVRFEINVVLTSILMLLSLFNAF